MGNVARLPAPMLSYRSAYGTPTAPRQDWVYTVTGWGVDWRITAMLLRPCRPTKLNCTTLQPLQHQSAQERRPSGLGVSSHGGVGGGPLPPHPIFKRRNRSLSEDRKAGCRRGGGQRGQRAVRPARRCSAVVETSGRGASQ